MNIISREALQAYMERDSADVVTESYQYCSGCSSSSDPAAVERKLH